MRRWNPSWNFLCGAPRTWHSAGRERGRSPSKGGWIWKGRTCFTRWWGQGHLSQSRTNTNCCSWFEPVQRSWEKLRCYWTSNDPDCFAALVNRPLHFISSETIVRKVESSVSHIRIPIEQHSISRKERKEQLCYRTIVQIYFLKFTVGQGDRQQRYLEASIRDGDNAQSRRDRVGCRVSKFA